AESRKVFLYTVKFKMKSLHKLFYLGSVLFWFALFYPALYILGRNSKKNYGKLIYLRRQIALLSSSMAGISYQVTHEKAVDWSIPYIIVANHTSNLDITAIMKACPAPFSFIG